MFLVIMYADSPRADTYRNSKIQDMATKENNKAKSQTQEQEKDMLRDNVSPEQQPSSDKDDAPKAEASQSETDKLSEQLAKKTDDYRRLMAEFDNYRKRTAKERLELIAVAGEDIIKGLLPVVDDFERALNVLKGSDTMAAAKEGTELIYNKLIDYLKSKGVAEIESVGKPLDTDYHEAVAQVPAAEDSGKGVIFDVVQKGYTLNGKVIRFAKVVVAI